MLTTLEDWSIPSFFPSEFVSPFPSPKVNSYTYTQLQHPNTFHLLPVTPSIQSITQDPQDHTAATIINHIHAHISHFHPPRHTINQKVHHPPSHSHPRKGRLHNALLLASPFHVVYLPLVYIETSRCVLVTLSETGLGRVTYCTVSYCSCHRHFLWGLRRCKVGLGWGEMEWNVRHLRRICFVYS